MIAVFDMDDTLYDEITYVKSGFKRVAESLSENFSIDQEAIYKALFNELEKNGRGSIFNTVLEEFSLLSKVNVQTCLSVYRCHLPDIVLNGDALDCLNRLSIPCYVVTDGNKMVQANKVAALGIETLVKKVLITHRYGVKHAKPSPYCFHKIAAQERVPNDEIVYIGDNPNKDFVGIKPLGFKTIRIKQGMFSNLALDQRYEAHTTVSSLTDVTLELLENIR